MNPTHGVRSGVPPHRRAAFSYRGLLIVLALLIAVPAIAWSLRPDIGWSGKSAGPMLYRVEKKDFIHEVTERGTVQSASNVEVRCEVKSRNSAGTQILYIVPEGTYVTPAPDWEPADPDNPEDPPDLLVKLDSSALEADLIQQEILCANSEAVVIQAQNVYDTAVITYDEYVNGKYVESKLDLEAAVAVAEEDLARAEEYREYSELLYSKGYIADRELQANAFDVQKRQLELEKANTALEVLEKYVKPKTIKQLDADIKTAEAKLKAAEHSYGLDLEELEEDRAQIANCTIRATEAGQVVYANITDRRGGSEVIIEEGTMVRERQVIIKLPDPKRMQVEAKVNEAKVTLVRPGLTATVRLDAFADLELPGTVERVNKYPAPSSFFTANIKEYETIIAIDNGEDDEEEAEEEDESATEMRPGMTAEVKIRVEELPAVLQVPVQAMIEHGGRHYCVMLLADGKEDVFLAREVVIGSTNDKMVVIEGGLEEGEEVVLNAAAHRGDINLPELPAETVNVDRRPARPAEAEAADGPGPSAPSAGGDPYGAVLSRFDSNSNGKLEVSEVPAQMAAADTNGDGVIDRKEIAAGMAKMSGGGPGGGGGGRGMGGGGGGGGGGRGQGPGGRP